MQVRLRDGRVATIPDGLSAEETLKALDRAELPEPSVGGYIGGALKAGALGLAEMGANVASLAAKAPGGRFGGVPINWEGVRQDVAAERATPGMRAYEAHSEELPWYGQLGTGALEFLPQMPLYELFGTQALAGLSKIPKAGEVFAKLARPGGGPVSEWAKAIGRAGISGGATGLVAGTPEGTPIPERIAKAGEEAAGFASAVAVLHPAFKAVGKVAGMAFERGRSRRARAKNEMLGDAEALRSEGLKPPEAYEAEEAPIVISPVEEELGPLKVTKNDFKRFKRLGYTRGDLVGMEMGDFVKILKERRVKGKVEEVAEGDTQGEGGLAGGERGGEEPRGTVQEPGAGQGEALTGGDVQAHEGLEAEAEVAAGPPSFQKSKEGRDPAKVGYLLRAGYQPKEIKKMSPEEFETNYAEAEAAGKATNAPEDLARIQKIKETILGAEAKEPIATAFRGPEDVAAKEEALRLLDEAAAKRKVEPPSELDVEEIRGEIEQIYNTTPEAVAPVKVALAKSEGRALTNMEKFRAQLETKRAAGLVEAEKLPSKGEVRRRKAKAKPEPKTAEDWEKLLAEEGMPAELSFGEQLMKPLQNEEGMLVGGKARTFEEARREGRLPWGSFSALHDRKVRREISDLDAEVDSDFDTLGPIRLDLGLLLDHPKLYKEYPELKDVKVSKVDLGRDLKGDFNPETRDIRINSRYDSDAAKDILLHEIQHWVQWKEGFAPGGNPDNFRITVAAAPGLVKLYERMLEMEGRPGWGSAGNLPGEKLEAARKLLAEKPKLEAMFKEKDQRLKELDENIAELKKAIQLETDTGAYAEKVSKLNRLMATRAETLKKYYGDILDFQGAYSDLSFDGYKIIAGEVESRSTASRSLLDDVQRMHSDPYRHESMGLAPSDWVTVTDAMRQGSSLMAERVKAEKQEQKMIGAKILGELEGERGSFSWKRKPPGEVLARGERKGEELIEVPEVRKVNPFKSLYQTPLYVNRPEPLADRHIYDLNVAELTASSNTAAHYATIMHAASGLSKEEQIKVKDILEGRTTGDVKLSAAAMKARKWFDMMKDKYKLFLREQYAKHLSPEEQAALRDLIMGKDIEEVKIDHQYKFVQSKSGKLVRRKNIDPKVLEEIAEEYKKIDSWGLTDYLSHVERGRYKMLVDGKLIGVGLSRGDARRKANAYWERNPGKTIYIDPEFSVFEPGATGLSRNQYYAVQSGLAKALQGKVEGLSKSEAQAIARSGMGGKFAIQPTEKFSPYTQPRRDIFEGEQNIFDVMRHYAYTMEKKMALDPVLENIRGGIWKIKDPQVKENLLALAEAVKGQYWWEDKVADGILRGVSQRLSEHGVEWDPKGSVFSRFTSTSGKIINNLVFGYRPVSGMINFASGQGHIWVKAGVEAMNRARVFGNTPEGKAVIEKLRPTLGETFVEESGGHQLVGPVERALSKAGVNWAPSSTLGKALKISSEPMGFFSAAENPNRELAALTAYTMAKGEGKSEEAALEFARRFTWHTQFTYNTAALGSSLRRPAGRLLLKFKPYLLKEMEFISQLKSPTEWARYMALQVALAGPKGFIVMAKSIPFMSLLVPAYFWDELESWANKEFPRASRGIGGFLGVDVSAPATFQFPNQVSDWAGPIASDIVKIYKAWQEVISNEEIPTKGVEKTITSIIPVARSFSRAWDAIVSPDGWVKDERGRRLYHIDNKAAYLAKAAFGAEDLSANQLRTEERIAEERDRTVSKNKQVTVDRFLDAIEDGKEIPDWLIEDMSKYNLRPASIRRAARFRALDPKTRRMLMTEIMRRPEVLEAYPDVPVGP